MAKKSFIDNNPALAFISTAQKQPEEKPVKQQAEPKAKSAKVSKKEKEKETPVEAPKTQKPVKTSKPKQQFLDIITPAERKSARLQLLLKPSTLEKLRTVSKEKNTSVNDLVNMILEKVLS